MINNTNSIGSLTAYTGCMFSGKTDRLVNIVKEMQDKGYQVLSIKHSFDGVRYGLQRLVSHNGHTCQCVSAKNASEICQHIDSAGEVEIIVIDEVQFFNFEITRLVKDLVVKGYQVIVAGLDTDFRGLQFGDMGLLMVEADQVIKLTAKCAVCGKSANRTQRLIDGKPASKDSPIVLVGGSESYEARCRKCHQVPDS